MKASRPSFFRGAVWLSFGAFVSKALGALYRIPLVSLVGSEGIGRYQMVYPVYSLLLTVSAVGVPAALSRLVARHGNAPVRTAFRFFLPLGGALTLLMAALAVPLAALQGDKSLFGGYLALAPSVFLVSAIAVLRGCFQGEKRMAPSSLSCISEQAIKILFGLLFAARARGDLVKATNGILFAVTLSEAFTLLWMLPLRRRAGREKFPLSALLGTTLPVTAASALLPLSSLLDSVLVVRLLSGTDSVALYGLLSGCAMTMISLPSSVCYGISSAVVPYLAGEGAKKRIRAALGATLLCALPAAAVLYCFPAQLVSLLFGSLSAERAETLAGLVRALSVSAVLLPAVQTLSGCLTGIGKPAVSAVALFCGCAAKHLLQVRLLPDPAFGIFGGAICVNSGYSVAFLIDLLYIVLQKEKKHDHDHRAWSTKRRPLRAGGAGACERGDGSAAHGAHEVRGEREGARDSVSLPRFRL